MSGHQPEIQGMRALSVLAVIWAHARFPGLPGGFIGVDVFFVISGFLITRLLLAEMGRTGRIDLLAFWARRARRLLPNAFAALLGTVLLALFVFPGYSPGKLTTEITFAALNLANIHFADEAVDYFQSEGAASPILHFWSLSVEEQFYLVWPPLLLGLGLRFRTGWPRAAAILLALIWCGSFAASLYFTYVEQPFAYFGTATRCWQLATGALLAVGWLHIERLPRQARAAMAWAGLAVILASMALLGEGAHYPGAWALPPTLGAAMLIAGFGAASPHGSLRRSLNAPFMQWIGERSYSLYLWHWPLLALARIAYPDVPAVELIALPVSLALACTAYSWIETPIRKGQGLALRPLPTLGRAVAAAGFVIAASYLYLPAFSLINVDMANRIASVERVKDEWPEARKDSCHLGPADVTQGDCVYGDAGAARDVVLFGDSHALQWFEALHGASVQAGWKMRSWTKSGCPAVEIAVHNHKRQPYTACWRWREEVMARLTHSNRPDLVVMSNFVSSYVRRAYDPATGKTLSADDAREALRNGFRGTIEKLLAAGVDVAIIRDTPQADARFEYCFIVNRLDCGRPRSLAFQERELEDMIAREFAGRVKVFDFADDICAGGKCPLIVNGVMVYRDTHHLASRFSASLAPRMVGLLQASARRDPAASTPPASAEAETHRPFASALEAAPIE